VEFDSRPTMAAEMKPLWDKIACGCMLMLSLATASAFDPVDTYGAPDWASPDPGSYLQGSSGASGYGTNASQDSAADVSRTVPQGYGSEWGSDWYSSDWNDEQVRGSRQHSWRANDGVSPPSARPSLSVPAWQSDDLGPDYDSGYRDRYGSYRPRRQDNDPYRGRSYTPPQDQGPEVRGYADPRSDSQSSGLPDDWRTRRRAPNYRFRDDPRLDEGGFVRGDAGYRFRPLTARELERQRESNTVPGFRPQRRDQRQIDTRSDVREAYGYETDVTPGNFYQRFYRADD